VAADPRLEGKALVLGGGGLAGLGWFAGLFHGMSLQGTDLRDADRMIGTSAGSATAAQLRSRQTLELLYARQTDPALIGDEAPPSMAAMAELMASFPQLNAIIDHAERMRAVGQMALDADTVAPEVRRAMIERRLSQHDWPEAMLSITAIDADSGALVAFDSSSEVSLIDAVSASCAVPGAWPVVEIAGRHYIDGGAYTVDNAHLAAGAERVVIASPFGTVSPAQQGFHLNDAVAALESGGTRVMTIEPDAQSRTAMGANPLDPATRRPSAEAGFAQGTRLADSVGRFWNQTF
jgi:NTE family protein